MNEAIKALLFGRKIANRLIKENKGKHMIFTFETVGDQCVELAYAQVYKRVNKIQHLAIITSNPDHAVFKYFPNAYDSLIRVSKKELTTLLKFYKSDLGQIYRRKHKEIVCAFYTSYVRSDLLFDHPYIRLADIEKMIYRLPLDTVPSQIQELPHEAWINELIEKKKLLLGKTVLVNPYANSCSGVPVSFFEKFAVMCQNSGFHVVTGVHAAQRPVRGTEGIEFSLEKTIALVNACGYVVGQRSGFLDLCTFANARIAAVDHASYRMVDAVRLEDWWPQNKEIRTFRHCGDEKCLSKEIVEYLKER